MANEEILRTNTTPVAATPNPEVNMASVQPVTIPLQIQPMVAQPQQTVQQVAQQQANQQAAAQVVQPTTTAPVPVATPAQPNNYSYNNFSNYKPKVQPFEPIVLDPVEYSGTEYKSQYAGAINQLANQILNMRFSYNPNEDDLLNQAARYTTQNTFESMNSKGILNSSLTAERVARVVGELIPTYEKMAREEFENNFNMLMNTAKFIMNIDDTQYSRWQADREMQWKKEQAEYEKAQDALKNAWERVDELGYVDNDAAMVLGVPVGTLSRRAREAKEEREYELETWYRKQEAQQKAEKELLLLKAQLEQEETLRDAEIAKESALYKAQLDRENALYEYQLKSLLNNQTSSSSGSSTSGTTTTSNTKKSIAANAAKIAASAVENEITKPIEVDPTNNMLRVNKDGKTYGLQLYSGMPKEEILKWGQSIGVDLSEVV